MLNDPRSFSVRTLFCVGVHGSGLSVFESVSPAKYLISHIFVNQVYNSPFLQYLTISVICDDSSVCTCLAHVIESEREREEGEVTRYGTIFEISGDISRCLLVMQTSLLKVFII